jgi:hypothetical protein
MRMHRHASCESMCELFVPEVFADDASESDRASDLPYMREERMWAQQARLFPLLEMGAVDEWWMDEVPSAQAAETEPLDDIREEYFDAHRRVHVSDDVPPVAVADHATVPVPATKPRLGTTRASAPVPTAPHTLDADGLPVFVHKLPYPVLELKAARLASAVPAIVIARDPAQPPVAPVRAVAVPLPRHPLLLALSPPVIPPRAKQCMDARMARLPAHLTEPVRDRVK